MNNNNNNNHELMMTISIPFLSSVVLFLLFQSVDDQQVHQITFYNYNCTEKYLDSIQRLYYRHYDHIKSNVGNLEGLHPEVARPDVYCLYFQVILEQIDNHRLCVEDTIQEGELLVKKSPTGPHVFQEYMSSLIEFWNKLNC